VWGKQGSQRVDFTTGRLEEKTRRRTPLLVRLPTERDLPGQGEVLVVAVVLVLIVVALGVVVVALRVIVVALVIVLPVTVVGAVVLIAVGIVGTVHEPLPSSQLLTENVEPGRPMVAVLHVLAVRAVAVEARVTEVAAIDVVRRTMRAWIPTPPMHASAPTKKRTGRT